MHRRSFLLAGGTVLGVAALTACTTGDPAPTASSSGDPTPDDLPVPRPVALRRSRWTTDPYHLGALSYLTVGSTSAARTALGASVGDRLFFAGEATSVDSPATVGGALDSGYRAAGEVLSVAGDGERIAVIGAGVAGAAAARRLADAGSTVIVLEAADRTGGRLLGSVEEDWGTVVELGAGAVVAGSSAAAALPTDAATTTETGVLESRSVEGVILEPTSIGAEVIAAAAESLAGAGDDISIAAAIRQVRLAGPSPADDLETPAAATEDEVVEAAVTADIRVPYGAEPTDLSARDGLADGPRGGDLRPDLPLSTLVDTALDGVDVRPSSVVVEIGYDDDGVGLRLGTGESLQVDRVVVTVSVGVLKSGDIRFSPALPIETVTAIDAIGMGSAEVVWVRFDEPFWSTDATSWSTVGSDLDIVEWRNLAPEAGSAVLVGLVGGSAAAALAGMSDDELATSVRRSLVPFLDR